MKDGKTILAFVPARGGSMRLPGKNIKIFSGKPLLAWTILEADKSRYIDRVMVSTNDMKIAKVAKRYGAEIPFMRPDNLATSSVHTVYAIFDALKRIEKEREVYDIIVMLQPTSPLRIVDDIDIAIDLLFSKNAGAVVSVCESVWHPYWVNTLGKSDSMGNFIKDEIKMKNKQALPKFYCLNGAVYAARTEYIKREKSFFGKETYAYIMPKMRSVDIDDEIDFKFAEYLMKERSSYGGSRKAEIRKI